MSLRSFSFFSLPPPPSFYFLLACFFPQSHLFFLLSVFQLTLGKLPDCISKISVITKTCSHGKKKINGFIVVRGYGPKSKANLRNFLEFHPTFHVQGYLPVFRYKSKLNKYSIEFISKLPK